MGVTFQAYCAGETQAARPCLRSPCCPVWSSPSGGGRGGTCGVCQRERTVHVTGSGGAVKTRLGAGPCGGHSFRPIWVCGEPKDPSPPFKALPSLGANPVQTPVMVNGHFFDPEVTTTSPYRRSRSPRSALGSRSTVRHAWSCGCSPGP